MTQNNLGTAYREIAKVSEGKEQREYLDMAVRAYEAAAEVWTEQYFPSQYKKLMNNIAILEENWKRLQEEK
ncbi:hypothetical protein ES703_24035 [subsurface metagenome]